ncbi:MAG: hypothetical protein AB8G23_01030 [Myxococcota bacterium]
MGSEIQSGADPEAVLERLYGCDGGEGREGGEGEGREGCDGRVDWKGADGILQVTAIAASDRATIALGPAAPLSPMDRFLLGFARARVEALVTTGAILRAEPELRHDYAEEPGQDAAWAAWRSKTLGLEAPPALILLSRSGNFPERHPAIEAASAGLLWTSRETRARLGPKLGALDVVVAEEFGAGVAAAIGYAQERLGLRRISVEAGPSASKSLYEETAGAKLSEVLLSLFSGELADEARAATFPAEARLSSLGLRKMSRVDVEQPSGLWTFERYRR